jgi:hypothetical protein
LTRPGGAVILVGPAIRDRPMTDDPKDEAEALLAAWAEQAARYPLEPARRPFIAAELARYAEALEAAGPAPLAAEPVATHRRVLVAGARS